MDILLKYKFCLLKRKIGSLMKEIAYERTLLLQRSNRYHDGRLNVDNLMEEYSKLRMTKIFQIKRELVKLKQNGSRKQ